MNGKGDEKDKTFEHIVMVYLALLTILSAIVFNMYTSIELQRTNIIIDKDYPCNTSVSPPECNPCVNSTKFPHECKAWMHLNDSYESILKRYFAFLLGTSIIVYLLKRQKLDWIFYILKLKKLDQNEEKFNWSSFITWDIISVIVFLLALDAFVFAFNMGGTFVPYGINLVHKVVSLFYESEIISYRCVCDSLTNQIC